jgi:F-type H+-transporting ATPase subunit delta
MVNSETASRKYAAALLSQLSPAETGKAAVALAVLAQVMASVPAAGHFCAHPGIERSEKEALLSEILKMAEAPASVQRFVLLLLDQRQLAALPVIAKSLQSEIDAAQGIQAVDAVSAAPLSEAQKKRLTEDLAVRLKTKVRMTFAVDAALLGGVLARTDNRVLDGSVQGRLTNLREKLLAD